ncbi:hypothetical protein AB1N83_007724 [Pleurotus pulmonarius]
MMTAPELNLLPHSQLLLPAHQVLPLVRLLSIPKGTSLLSRFSRYAQLTYHKTQNLWFLARVKAFRIKAAIISCTCPSRRRTSNGVRVPFYLEDSMESVPCVIASRLRTSDYEGHWAPRITRTTSQHPGHRACTCGELGLARPMRRIAGNHVQGPAQGPAESEDRARLQTPEPPYPVNRYCTSILFIARKYLVQQTTLNKSGREIDDACRNCDYEQCIYLAANSPDST